MVRHRLRSLLPIEQEARNATPIPHELINDIVLHFRRMTMQLPWNGDPSAPLADKEHRKLEEFTDDFFGDYICHFPDKLLRRLRPHAPTRCNLDCWIADCLVREVICKDFGIPYEDVGQQERKRVFTIKDCDGVHDRKPWVLAMSVIISMYLAKLSVKLAAWLPYELLIVQAPANVKVHAAFVGGGADYYDDLEVPDFDELPDSLFRVCLDHVLEWMDGRNWHDTRLLKFDEEDHREMFWVAIDMFARQRRFM